MLEHGWAYGREGTALQGKAVMNATTTGGSEAAYQKEKARIEAEWNLPATDVFREGAEPLVNAACALLDD